MRKFTKWRLGLLSLAVISAQLVFATFAVAEDQPLPLATTHLQFNSFDPLLGSNSDGSVGEAQYKNPSSPICTTTTSSTNQDVNTDCEGVAPHNETTIAVNPTNPLNIIGSANDYQLSLSSGGTTNETAFSRAHVTFDGGKTWTTYPVNFNGYIFTGDPALSFDKNGTAYLATLGFVVSQGGPTGVNPDILVASSSDGGRTWTTPVKVARGSGSFGSPGVFNDKEFITAWGNGNAIVTWTVFNDGIKGSYINSPIFAAVTHESGKTWTSGVEISGSAAFCIGARGGNACDQDQVSVPVVAADGSIYVSFLSTEDTKDFRDQYLVVKVDPTSGALVGGPYKAASVVDGTSDYPVNAAGRQTYQDSQFRTWSAGNIAADPTNASHLAVVWSDMRNSTLPAPTDPYQAKTNSDIVVTQSYDGGKTWSKAVAISTPGDQFMPWSAYDNSGILRIGYFDRSYDSANHKYGYTLATETKSGSLKFNTTQLSGTLSDPTRDDRWFSGRTVNTQYPHPSSFLGDYSGIAVSPAGSVVSLWTDMRVNTCLTTRCGAGEDAFFSQAK